MRLTVAALLINVRPTPITCRLQPTMNSLHLSGLSCNHKRLHFQLEETMMFRKYSFLTMLAVALVLISAIAAMAQSGQLRGHVKLKQADGTTVPAVSAAIDVVRLDIGG